MIDFRPRPGLGQRVGASAFAALAALALASCSSSKPAAQHIGVSSNPPSSQSTPPATTTVGDADAQTTAAIKDAYAKVFASATPENVSISLLQNGAQFKATIESQAKSSLAQGASAAVTSVTLQSPNTAKVVFTLSINGSPILPNTAGYAIRENGTWKVAGTTFCGLLAMQNSAPPVCNTAATTTLPK
ncbi:MAG: hypothetical protein ABI232_06860 [Jatrophihabitantaceae bacterium]